MSADATRPYYIDAGEGMWPHPSDPNEVGWRLRYSEPSRTDALVAASYIHAFRTLVAMPQAKRNKIIADLRNGGKTRGKGSTEAGDERG